MRRSFVSDWLLNLGAVAMLSLMVALTTETVFRYVFRSPLGWPTRLSGGLLLAIIVFLPLAAVARNEGHVRVRFLADRWGERLRVRLWGIASLLEAPTWAVISYAAARSAYRQFQLHPTVGAFRVPLWVTMTIIALGTAAASIQTLSEFVKTPDRWR